ncbi:MAG: large subunit ribosomal protein L4 [Gammaproteobacteria bacterium]|jgi:large subunit ribosomal protein L4
MELTLHQSGKKELSKMAVSDSVFDAKYNEPLVHQALTTYMAGARSGTKAQKTRAQVRGGGKKPFKQKGTGRARAGTSRSPLWRGGGIHFAAQPRSYKKKLNRKMYQGAIRSILSELARQGRLTCIDSLQIDEPRTKHAKQVLTDLGLANVLIITDDVTSDMYLATRNLPMVDVIDTTEIDPYTLIGFGNVLITKTAVDKVEAWLG